MEAYEPHLKTFLGVVEDEEKTQASTKKRDRYMKARLSKSLNSIEGCFF